MARALQTAWNEFLYGGHLQALGAVAILWTVAVLFHAPFPWGLPVATYAVSYAIYLYNRLFEIGVDAATNPARTEHINAYKRIHWWVFLLSSLVAAIVTLLTASVHGAVFIGVMFVFGLLYTHVFKAFTRIVPGFKVWYVALGFTALVFLPFAYVGLEVPFGALAGFAGWVFWNAAIMQTFLDVKDARSDAQAGLRTIPLLLGRERTFAMLATLTILAAVPPLVWGVLDASYPLDAAALAVAPLLSLLALLAAHRGSYRGYLVESGKFISWPALLVISHAFTA